MPNAAGSGKKKKAKLEKEKELEQKGARATDRQDKNRAARAEGLEKPHVTVGGCAGCAACVLFALNEKNEEGGDDISVACDSSVDPTEERPDDEVCSDISHDGSEDNASDTEGQYIKVAMTPEEAANAKEALRAMRKVNKKIVREARTEKRKTKIKKKDKNRAINKTKGSKKSK